MRKMRIRAVFASKKHPRRSVGAFIESKPKLTVLIHRCERDMPSLLLLVFVLLTGKQEVCKYTEDKGYCRGGKSNISKADSQAADT